MKDNKYLGYLFEVAWILPEGRLTYWRGRIRGVHFES